MKWSILFGVALFPTLALAADDPTATAQPAPKVEVIEQVVAVKDVCAWPKLTLLPNGEIAAVMYDQPRHGGLPGDVACWVSADQGKTWEKRTNVTKHMGDTAWFNHALGVAHNGDLMVVTSGRQYKASPDRKTFKHVEFFTPITARSADQGRSWTIAENFVDGPGGEKLIPFGNIERGEAGVLRVAAYHFTNRGKDDRTDTCYSVMSEDDGKTWKIQSAFGTPEANETDIARVGDRRWLAAARNLGLADGKRGHSLDIYASDDDAATWTKVLQVAQPLEHPADLLRLADGRILLTCGDRRPGSFGVTVRLSADGGRTWSAATPIAKGVQNRDSGYPCTVQFKDGTFATVFYASKTEQYGNYQMAVVRWKLAGE